MTNIEKIAIYSNKNQGFGFSVKISANEVLTTTKIREIVKNVLILEGNRSAFGQINVNLAKSVYRIDAEAEKAYSPQQIALNEVSLRICNLSAKALPEREATFEELRDRFTRWAPASVPLIKYFWFVMIYPMAMIFKLFSPKVKDTSLLHQMGLPRHEEILTTTLKWGKQLLTLPIDEDPMISLGEEFTLGKQLEEAIHLDKSDIGSLFFTLRERHRKAKNRPGPVNLMLLPTGYWNKEDTFQPVLLSFYKNEDGKLALSEFTYTSDNQPIARDFVWKSMPNRCDKIFPALFDLERKPQGNSSSEGARDLFVLGLITKKIKINITNEQPTPPTSLTIEAYREKLWFASGAKLSNPPEHRRKHVQEDPWKILQETLRLQFPEVPTADKLVFAIEVLNDTIEKVLSGIDVMPQKLRRKWLHRLENDRIQLERNLRKATRTDATITKHEGRFFQRLDLLRMEIAKFELENQECCIQRGENLNRIQSTPFQVQLPETHITQMDHPQGKNQVRGGVTIEDRQLIQTIKTGFNTGNELKETLQALKKLQNEMDQAVDQMQYQRIIDLYRLVTPTIPTPDNPFWDTLYQQAEKEESIDILQEYSLHISNLTQFFWEIKLKKWQLALSGDEWVLSMGVEAAVCKLLQLSLKLSSTLNKKTYEELCLSKIFTIKSFWSFYHNGSGYNSWDLYRMFRHFEHEAHLRPTLNPELEKRFFSIKRFFGSGSQGQAFNNIFDRKSAEEPIAEICVDAWQKKFSQTLPKNRAYKVWEAGYHRYANGKFSGQGTPPPHIPRQLTDLKRLQVMMTPLILPDCTVGLYGVNLGGAMGFVGAFLRNTAGNEDENSNSERRNAAHKIVHQKIQSLKRLDVGPVSSLWGVIVNYGIFERGSNPGDNPPLASSPTSGMTDYYAAVGIQPRMHIHASAMGNPKSPYYLNHCGEYIEETEGTCLNRMLAIEGGNPLDDFASASLEFSRSNVYDSKNVEEVFDRILQRFDECDLPEKQRRFLAVAFRPNLIQRLLKENPDYFIRRGEELMQSLIRAMDEGLEKRADFLFFLLNHMSQQVQLALQSIQDDSDIKNDENPPTLDKHKLTRILQILPSPTKSIDGSDHTYLEWLMARMCSPNLMMEEQMNLSSYFVTLFSNHIHCNTPDKLSQQLSDPNILKHLFIAASRLSIGSGVTTIPMVAESAFIWIKDYFVPWLTLSEELPIPQETISKALDFLVDKSQGVSLEPGLWKPQTGDVMIWEKGNSKVDLLEMAILSVCGKQGKGIKIPLPKAVRESTEYAHLFGNNGFDCFAQAGNDPGDYFYSFTDDQGDHFKIIHNASKESLFIEKLFTPEISGKKNPLWYRLVLFSEQDSLVEGEQNLPSTVTSNLYYQVKDGIKGIFGKEEVPKPTMQGGEAALVHRGVWINIAHPHDGICLIPDGGHPTDPMKDVYHLSFDKSFVLKRMVRRDGWKVVCDTTTHHEDAVGCLHKSLIISHRKPSKNHLANIKLVGQNITLIRSSKTDSWIVEAPQKDFNGYRFVVGGGEILKADRTLADLGASLEQFGLCFEDQNQERSVLLLWPNQVTSPHAHKKLPTEILAVEKNVSASAPLQITFTKTAEPQGSSGSFLMLAYLAAVKHDYVRVEFFLKKAKVGRLSSKEELMTLREIAGLFQSLPQTSFRSRAIKLKAELTLRLIVRQQTENPLFEKSQWRAYLEKSEYISELFQETRSDHAYSPFAQDDLEKFLKEHPKEIALDATELEELRRIHSESLNDLSEKTNRLDHLNEKEMSLIITTVTNNFQFEILKILALKMMQTPPKDSQQLIHSLSYPNQKSVLNHFFQLWNLIIEQNLHPIDIAPLFGPIQGLEASSISNFQWDDWVKMINTMNIQKLEKDIPNLILIQVDFARKMLLTLAYANLQKGQQKGLEIDLKALWLLKNSHIPNGIISAIGIIIAPPSDEDFARQYEQLVTTKLQSLIQLKLPPFTLMGEEASHLMQSHLLEEIHTGKKLSVTRVTQMINDDPNLFGPNFTPMLQLILQDPSKLEQFQNYQGPLPLSKAVELIESESGVNLLEVKREVELEARISQVEKAIKTQSVDLIWPDIDQASCDYREIRSLEISPTRQIDSSAVIMNQMKLDAASDQIKGLFDKGSDKVEETENGKLLEGMDAAKKSLISHLQEKVFDPEKLLSIRKELNQHSNDLIVTCSQIRKEIMSRVCVVKPPCLATALAQKKKIGDAALFNQLLNAYQKLLIDDQRLNEMLVKFLILATEEKMLRLGVSKIISHMDTLKQNQTKDENWWKEWNIASRDLSVCIDQATDRKRYFTKETKQLCNPRFSRKYLVCEYRNGIILRPQQIGMIQQMVANPSSWYELRMGMGKTSYIFPIVLMLLAEKGFYPVGIVKDELLQQNLDELDLTSRLLLETAGLQFSYSMNDSVSPTVLAEKYYRLLKVKQEKGYVITTVNTKATLEHHLGLLRTALSNELNKIVGEASLERLQEKMAQAIQIYRESQNDPNKAKEVLKQYLELFRLQKRIYWLSKIRNLLNGNKEQLGFQTQQIGDEVDDIFSITNENNLALGEPKSLNKILCNVMNLIMISLFTSKDKEVLRLKEMMQRKEQAALRRQEVTEVYMPALAKEVLKEDLFASLRKCDQANLLSYLCSSEGKAVENMPVEVNPNVAALKRLLQVHVPNALAMNPGIDIAVKESDGFTVGPQVSGQEKKGVLFGNEYDVIANHFVTYGTELRATPFVEQALESLREMDYESYSSIYQQANDQGYANIISFLNRPDQFNKRLYLLRRVIIDRTMIRRFSRQYVLNVQETVFNQHVGGMTGTLNDYLLPKTQGNHTPEYIPRIVEGETFLRIACGDPKPVGVVENDDEAMLDEIANRLADTSYKAILNGSASLSGKNAKLVIAHLRKKEKAKERLYVYINPSSDPAERTPQIWYPHNEKAEPITKDELKKLLADQPEWKEKICFLYNPPDCRGTDLPVPAGKALVITGATTKMPDFLQQVWRLRGLGDKHTVEFLTTHAVANRIDAAELTWKEIVNDIKKQTLEGQKSLNLKAMTVEIRSIAMTGMRQLLHAHQITNDDPNYWSLTQPELRLVDSMLDEFLFQIVEPRLIRNMDITFDSDYQPTTNIETKEMILQSYLTQIEHVDDLQKKLKKIDGWIDFAQSPFVQIALQHQAGMSDVRIQKLKAHTTQRITTINNHLNSLIEQLNLSKEKFENEYESKHTFNLAEKIPSNGSAIAASEEQVQQQQQTQQQTQQQQQQLQQQKVKPVKGGIQNIACNFWEPKNIINKHYHWCSIWHDNNKGKLHPDLLDVRVTTNMRNILSKFDSAPAAFLARVWVINDEVYLIAKSDYHYSLAPYLQAESKYIAEGKSDEDIKSYLIEYYQDDSDIKQMTYPNQAVYTLLNGVRHGKGITINAIGANEPDLANKPKLRWKILLAKWRLGFYQFSKEEIQDWRDFWDQSSKEAREQLWKRTRLVGNNQQLNFLKTLSPLIAT